MSENSINQAPPIQSELETTNNINSSRVSGKFWKASRVPFHRTSKSTTLKKNWKQRSAERLKSQVIKQTEKDMKEAKKQAKEEKMEAILEKRRYKEEKLRQQELQATLSAKKLARMKRKAAKKGAK